MHNTHTHTHIYIYIYIAFNRCVLLVSQQVIFCSLCLIVFPEAKIAIDDINKKATKLLMGIWKDTFVDYQKWSEYWDNYVMAQVENFEWG